MDGIDSSQFLTVIECQPIDLQQDRDGKMAISEGNVQTDFQEIDYSIATSRA